MRRAKSTIVLARIVAVAKEETRDVRILLRSRHRKSIVVIVTVCFTDKSVTRLTSKGVKTFAVNYKYNPKKKHVCGQAFCRNCKETKDVNHRCFIQPIEEEKEETAWGLGSAAEDVDEIEEGDNKADSEEKEKVEPLVCPIDFECSVDEVKDFKDVRVG